MKKGRAHRRFQDDEEGPRSSIRIAHVNGTRACGCFRMINEDRAPYRSSSLTFFFSKNGLFFDVGKQSDTVEFLSMRDFFKDNNKHISKNLNGQVELTINKDSKAGPHSSDIFIL